MDSPRCIRRFPQGCKCKPNLVKCYRSIRILHSPQVNLAHMADHFRVVGMVQSSQTQFGHIAIALQHNCSRILQCRSRSCITTVAQLQSEKKRIALCQTSEHSRLQLGGVSLHNDTHTRTSRFFHNYTTSLVGHCRSQREFQQLFGPQ